MKLNQEQVRYVAKLANLNLTEPEIDRMVEMVAKLKTRGDMPEDLVIQTGIGGFAPSGLQTFETLPFEACCPISRKQTS